jgi:hypothetical protein
MTMPIMTEPIATPIPTPQPPIPEPRTRANRANAMLSTGPRTPAGKQRSSLNALRHGLTAASPVLPSEDRAAYEDHRRRFFDEYHPATPTESQLVQELADTSWRLNRIPLLEGQVIEAETLARAAAPPEFDREITFDIVDAHRLIANLAVQGQRLSRQFQRSLDKLREIQAVRTERDRRDLKDAAALLELHKHRGIPWEPADHGFVFSKPQVESHAQRLRDLNEARRFEHVLFDMPPPPKLSIKYHSPLIPNSQSPRASARDFFVAAPAPLAAY